MAVSVGVKVTPWLPVETGTVDDVVQAKLPGTLAVPPESAESLNACPAVMAEAVGAAVIEGVALAIVKVWETGRAAL